MPKTISVKFKNHFKVDVHAKDVLLFEQELNQKGLDFYVSQTSEPSSGSLVQYYLLDKDKPVIDSFLENTDIIVLSEILEYSVFGDQRKFMNRYLKLVGVFIVLMLLMKTVDAVVNP